MQIAVGAAFHRIIGEGGQVVLALVEGYGQAAARAVLTKEQLGHGSAAQRAGIPALHDGIAVLLREVDGQRGAGGKHENRGLADRHDLFEQLLLKAGQTEMIFVARTVFVRCVALFAFDGWIKAKAQHDHVCLLSDGNRLSQTIAGQRQPFALVAPERATLGVIDARLACAEILDAFQNRDIAGGGAVVVALKHGAAVGVGADDRHGGELVRVQRQDAVILQQHLRAAGGFQRNLAVFG